MSCDVNPELVSRLADGELPREEEREVRTHVESCSECRELHERLLRLAELYRAAHRPEPVRADFADRTMKKLATIRRGRARPPRGRQLLIFGAALASAAAAALILVAVLRPGEPVGTAEGLLLRYENSGWVWAGESASIQERLPYAVPSAPARIRLGSVRIWMDHGTFLTIEDATTARLHLLGGTLRIRNPGASPVRIRTPIGVVEAPSGAEVVIRCPLPSDPDAIQTLIRDASSPPPSLGTLLLPAARAGLARGPRRVVLECLAGLVTLPDEFSLRTGERLIRFGSPENDRRAPCDTEEIRRATSHVETVAALSLHGLGQAALDVAERALDGDDDATRIEIERLLITMTPALTSAEFERIETWLTGEDRRRITLGARMAARRGRVSAATRRELQNWLALDSEKSHLARAAAVAVLSSTNVGPSSEALRTLTAAAEPSDLRLLAAWGLLAARDSAGPEALEEILRTGDAALARAAARSVRLNSDVLTIDDWKRLVRSPHPTVRVASLQQIGFLGTRGDLPLLEEFASDEEEADEVRRSALDAISRLAGPADRPRLAALVTSVGPDLGRMLILSLAPAVRDPAIAQTLLELTSGVPDLWIEVLVDLAWHDSRSRDVLFDQIDRVPTVHLVLASLPLFTREEDRAREAYDSAADKEPEGSARWVTLIECLSDRDPRRAATLLLTALAENPPAEARARSLGLLARLGQTANLGRPVAEALIAGLRGSEDPIRAGIALALATTGDADQARPVLRALLRSDPSPSVGRAAAEAIAERPGDGAAEALAEAALRPEREVVITALVSLASMGRFLDGMRVLLEAEDAEVRLWAATARAGAGSPPDREPLARAFAEADLDSLRSYLTGALPIAKRDEDLARWIRSRCLDHPSPRIRIAAATFILLGEPDVSPELRARWARDTHWFVRLAGAAACDRTRKAIALALETAPATLSNAMRRQLASDIPILTWYPEPVTTDRAIGNEPPDAQLAGRVIAILARAYDEGGAEMIGDDGVADIGRSEGLIRAVRLAGSLAPAATDQDVEIFYRRFAGSLR